MADRVRETVDEVENLGRVEFHIRGKHYVIGEIEATDYEKHVDAATTDPDEGTVDMGLLTKLIALDAVTVDGKPLDAEAWSHEKFPVVNRVHNEVRKLHYIELETDEEIAKRKKGDAEEAKKKGRPSAPNS